MTKKQLLTLFSTMLLIESNANAQSQSGVEALSKQLTSSDVTVRVTFPDAAIEAAQLRFVMKQGSELAVNPVSKDIDATTRKSSAH